MRLIHDTIGVVSEGGKQAVIWIPAGAEIVALQPLESLPADPPNRQVVVHWQGRAVSVFAVDLRQRAEPAGNSR